MRVIEHPKKQKCGATKHAMLELFWVHGHTQEIVIGKSSWDRNLPVRKLTITPLSFGHPSLVSEHPFVSQEKAPGAVRQEVAGARSCSRVPRAPRD